MYADRYPKPEGVRLGSLTVAIAVNAALIGALVFMSPTVQKIVARGALVTRNIPIDPPPPENRPETKPQPQQKAVTVPDRVETTKTIADVDPIFITRTIDPSFPGKLDGVGTGGTTVIDPPEPLPVFVDAMVDTRYARDLQPAYPPGERRAENEGRVVVKVLIGTDGRVKQAERVSATSDAFWRATRERAFARWRFRPATRNGVAVEAWRTMTLRFELND